MNPNATFLSVKKGTRQFRKTLTTSSSFPLLWSLSSINVVKWGSQRTNLGKFTPAPKKKKADHTVLLSSVDVREEALVKNVMMFMSLNGPGRQQWLWLFFNSWSLHYYSILADQKSGIFAFTRAHGIIPATSGTNEETKCPQVHCLCQQNPPQHCRVVCPGTWMASTWFSRLAQMHTKLNPGPPDSFQQTEVTHGGSLALRHHTRLIETSEWSGLVWKSNGRSKVQGKNIPVAFLLRKIKARQLR